MGRVDIKDVTEENAGDLARVCVPSHRWDDTDFVAIDCIYVPPGRWLCRGVANRLFSGGQRAGGLR
ncbi:MAG: hypothetical protein ACLFVD_00115 [Dehalococcoidia bacterium]